MGVREDGAVVHLTVEDAFDCRDEGDKRNVVAAQAWVTPGDYASEGSFSLRVKGYLEAARDQGWLGDRTVVVYPEHLGTWLVVMDEPVAVHRADTAARALRRLALAHPLSLLHHWARSPAASYHSATSQPARLAKRARWRAARAAFTLKAPRMAEVYHRVFSELARIYHVTIVAGSIVLPEPRLHGGALVAGRGPLANVSVIYRYDGAAVALARQVFVGGPHSALVSPGRLEDVPVLNTPAGRLGVLLGADSWHPQAYDHLRSRRVEVLAVLSYCRPDGAWEAPWRGYNGTPAPATVNPDDVGNLTGREAWAKYGAATCLATCGASAGVNVFLRGRLWDLGSDGRTTAFRDGEMRQLQATDGASVLNLWL